MYGIYVQDIERIDIHDTLMMIVSQQSCILR